MAVSGRWVPSENGDQGRDNRSPEAGDDGGPDWSSRSAKIRDLSQMPGSRVLSSVPLQPSAWAEEVPSPLLRKQLRRGFCDREEQRRLVQLLDPYNPRWTTEFGRYGALNDLAKVFVSGDHDDEPDWPIANWEPLEYSQGARDTAPLLRVLWKEVPAIFLEEPWAAGVFLRSCALRFWTCGEEDSLFREMAPEWRAMCRGRGDLSWASEILSQLKPRELGRLLKVLSADRTELWIDSCAHTFFFSPPQLRTLLRYAHVRPVRAPADEEDGIGCLSRRIIEVGDLKLVQRAVDLGCFQGESVQRLVAYVDRLGKQNLRSSLLSVIPDPEAAIAVEDLEPGKEPHFEVLELEDDDIL